jgi:hypothetical protein
MRCFLFVFCKWEQLTLGDIWEKETKMRLKELCCAGVGWIHLAHKTDWWMVFVNAVMNPYNKSNYMH